jgi:hypothetical protein
MIGTCKNCGNAYKTTEEDANIYKTEIEWLRARWMDLRGYARNAESDLSLFAAPDLTAEEIRDCEFEDLESLVEFVERRG